MAMKQTLTKDMFRFQMNQVRPDNFSYEGQGELFNYFEVCEEGTDSEIEFDPIAICCDFSQCSLDEFLDCFKIDCEKVASNTYKKTVITSYIEKNGFWFAFVEDDKEIVFENF
jgi:hypothetical protein